MVVRDFNFVGVAILPDETDPPLVIDSNAVLSLAVSAQRFESVAGRHRQVMQFLGCVEHGQLPQPDPLDGLELSHSLAVKKALRLFRAERFNHYVRV